MKHILLVLVSTLIIKNVSAQPPAINSYSTANRYDMNINDASKHIGEYKIVKGVVYKVEVRHDKHNLAKVLFYLRDTKNPVNYLIKIIRVNIKGNTREANWFKNIKVGEVDYSEATSHTGDYDYWYAEGKIFLFEGKPAILTDFNELGILEEVGD